MKLTRFFTLIFIIMLLAACADHTAETEQDVAQDSEEQSTDEESGIEVDKGLLNVEIKLPSNFFDEEELASIEENIEQETQEAEVTKNDDGSITVKMSKSDHKKMLEEMKEEFIVAIEDILEDENFVSIQDISYNKDFSNLTMVVSDKETFENSLDGFATLTLGVGSLLYQAFDGKDLEKDKVMLEIVDDSTNETIHEIIYPDALEEMGEEE